MNSNSIEDIANAVLYEGYMLYPYRPSAIKNRQRFNFGVLYPKFVSEVREGVDPCFMQTQCLIQADEATELTVKLRFLQGISREIGTPDAADGFDFVDSIELDGVALQPSHEAMEREVLLSSLRLSDLQDQTVKHSFCFPAVREIERIQNREGKVAALIVRTQKKIDGVIRVSVRQVGEGVFELTVLTSNETSVQIPDFLAREELLEKCLLSAHTVLTATQGKFVSLLDPPGCFQKAASECKNVGAWPVLVGEEDATNAMLSSPIILYDYPQIAPESVGNLFDGTEIDEILALRILTLTEDEKREIRQSDDRAREVLDRTEAMAPEQWAKLHGAIRGMVGHTPEILSARIRHE